MDKITLLENRITELERLFFKDNFSNKKIERVPVQFLRGLQTDPIIGSSFGQAGDKTSVNGATPIVQQAAIVAPTGGGTVDSQSRTTIGTIITVLRNFGITS